jgi:hypothetical protein
MFSIVLLAVSYILMWLAKSIKLRAIFYAVPICSDLSLLFGKSSDDSNIYANL